MKLGWTLIPDGEYLLPLDALLAPAQENLLCQLLEGFAPQSTPLDETLHAQLCALCEKQGLALKEATGAKLVSLARLHLDGFGPFSTLLSDDQLEEITLVGLGKPVFVCHRTKGWLRTNLVVREVNYAVEICNKMARPLGRRLTFQQPRLSAILPDGSRLHACTSPVCKDGLTFCVRKFRRERIGLGELLSSGYLGTSFAAFLWLLLETDSALLIAGNTASGKTTFLNALSTFVPATERIVTLEESPELCWPHEHQVRLVSSEHAGLSDLVADSLRLRPDRVLVGEVRTAPEAKALFDVLLSGHAKGAYGTFHADTADEALLRLTSLGIRPDDLDALDALVVARRTAQGRSVTELCVVDRSKAVPVFHGERFFPGFFRTRAFRHFRIPKSEFLEEFADRVRRLDQAAADPSTFDAALRSSP